MGKLLPILGACLAAFGGGSYALYAHLNPSCPLAQCALASKCCGGTTECEAPAAEPADPAMAVAGPAAVFATTHVKAELPSCCAYKAVAAKTVFNCCEEPAASHGLEAVAGATAGVAKK